MSMEKLMQELKDEFPNVDIQFVNETICANLQGFWYGIVLKGDGDWKVNEDAKAIVANYSLFKETEASLIERNPSCRGDYLVINGADSKFLHKTEDSALRGKEGPHSFVGRIGAGEFKEEVLALSEIEKPPNFDAIDNRVIHPIFHAHRGFHINGTRRWLEVSLQLTEGRGFRRELFLLDTGSPKSIIIEEVVSNWLYVSERKYNGNPVVEVEGVRTEFETQLFDGGEDRTRNINLLGTNFLNNFVLMDDYVSGMILVLKRASPPIARV